MKKLIEMIKKKWLINGTKTFILIAIFVAVFVLINTIMQKLDLTPIDLTENKLYTLTDASKQKVGSIQKKVNLYFIGFTEQDSTFDLAKQYQKVNGNITAEIVDVTKRTDIAQKYGVTTDTMAIIVECDNKSKVLTTNELYTYDTTTYETIDIAEEGITGAIQTVTADKIPKVYFLDGYSDYYSLSKNMNYLNVYLENETMQVDTVDLFSTKEVPNDCDTLVIMTPTRDFEDATATAILNYINQGGNILWLNGVVAKQQNLPNVQKILDQYGVGAFEVGVICEQDSSKMLEGMPEIIKPDVINTDILGKIDKSGGVLFIDATKINIKENELKNLNVEQKDLLVTGSTSFFRSNVSNTSQEMVEGDKEGSFVVGTELTKTLKNNQKSKIIIFGENYFISDNPVDQIPSIQIYNNKNMILNTIAYLNEREQDITVRKSTGTVTYTATEQEDLIIRGIIFAVPAVIILAGILVWQVRRRKA